ncbi:MAG: 4'-phosphopantetheinyl transferase superfamily protein [Gallionellaceae bacterium]
MMDVWRIDLEHSGVLDVFMTVLDEQEKIRADRFRFEKHFRRFVIAHAATRSILSAYCGIRAAELIFEYNAYGKPFIANHGGPSFNLSHSDGVALCSVSSGGEIGVDIEKCRAIDFLGMSERFFSTLERKLLANLQAERAIDGFFTTWARKEAYIKAKGLGLSLPLDAFSVETNPNLPASLLESEFAPEDVEKFRFWDLQASEGYKAALAYSGQEEGPPILRQWNFNKSELALPVLL